MWRVEQLRLTMFFAPPIVAPSDVWNRLLGFDAPAMSRVQEGTTFLHVFEAPSDTGFHTVRATPSKVDFLYGNFPQLQSRQDEQLTTEALVDEVPRFLGMIDTFVGAGLGDVSRLAVGAVLLQEVADREAGYLILKPLLQRYVNVDPAGSTDMLFRINRRRTSTAVPTVSVNRVSEWSVAMQVLEALEVSAELAFRSSDRRTRYLPRVALDVNSVPEHDVTFSADTQKALLREFVDMAIEIASEGDTP